MKKASGGTTIFASGVAVVLERNFAATGSAEIKALRELIAANIKTFKGPVEQVDLPADTLLFKFTEHELYAGHKKYGTIRIGEGGAALSPWWCSVNAALDRGEQGLDALISAAAKAGRSPRDYVREKLAVMYGWNALAGQGGLSVLGRVQKVRLLKPIYALCGQAAPQPNDKALLTQQLTGKMPEHSSAELEGGLVQLWIPNMTIAYAMDAGMHLLP
jgi:hypothetical protein